MTLNRTAAAAIMAAAALGAAPAAHAHPHQFIDTYVRLILDGAGRLEAIRLDMSMDETESLYIASEFGLDPDGPLTEEQSRMLYQAYADGYAEFHWLTFMRVKDKPIEIDKPRAGTASMADGVLRIVWETPLVAPLDLDAAPILLQFYDPTYFAEVFLKGPPEFSGPGAENCGVALKRFEADAEAQELQRLLALVPRNAMPDDPTVGRRFADHVEARCGDGSGRS